MMNKFEVYRCPGCLRGRVVRQAHSTASCSYCMKRFQVKNKKCYGSFDALENAIAMVGLLNCGSNKNREMFVADVMENREAKELAGDVSSFDDVHQYIGFKLGKVTGKKNIMVDATKYLTSELGEFTQDDVSKVLCEAGKEGIDVEKYLGLMLDEKLIVIVNGAMYRYLL